jgi:hypothetical protein
MQPIQEIAHKTGTSDAVYPERGRGGVDHGD